MTPAMRAFQDVMMDVVHLCRFRDTQKVQRGVWDNMPPAVRKRLIENHYVRVQKYQVLLTALALEVMEYREATA